MAKKQVAAVTSMKEARRTLQRMEEINAQIVPLQNEAVQLKKDVTAFAVSKKAVVIQLDGCYYRLIERSNRIWVATPDDMPTPAPKGARSLKEICKGVKVKVKGKSVPLWNAITKRVPDPIAIENAVNQGWIDEDEIHRAYLEKPQSTFLQRYEGDSPDA